MAYFTLSTASCPYFLLTMCVSYGEAVAMSRTLGRTYAFVPFHHKWLWVNVIFCPSTSLKFCLFWFFVGLIPNLDLEIPHCLLSSLLNLHHPRKVKYLICHYLKNQFFIPKLFCYLSKDTVLWPLPCDVCWQWMNHSCRS